MNHQAKCTLLLLIAYVVYPFQLGWRGDLKGVWRPSTIVRRAKLVMEDVQFKLVTYNILAPCYHRIVVDGQKAMEADYEDMYMQRNRGIIERLKEEDADIVCIQEFWGANENLMELYMKELCGRSEDGGNQLYQMTEMRRSSHWRARDDGLAIFVRDRARSGQPQLKIEDTKRIVFHDCGDRVALMLLLSIAPPAPSTAPPQHFICVNTHLLFPHNQYSSNIRLREVTKILGFVEAYRQRDLCTDVCGRADVRIPVIVTGDFNGSPRGAVFQLMKQQNFQVAYEEHCRSITPVQEAVQDVQQVKNLQADINTDTLGVSGSASGDDCGCASDSTVTTSSTTDMKAKIDLRSIDIKEELAGVIETTNLEPWMKWVSHRSHQQKNVAVDHIFYLNPSDQGRDLLPPIPDWTNLVYKELMLRVLDTGVTSLREVFKRFDQDTSNYVSQEEFTEALQDFGFRGEGTPALTEEEIKILVQSADKDGDGMIDYKEFYDRFWLAAADDENLTERGRYLLREEEEDEEDEAAAITIYEASTSAQSVMYNEEESNDLQITTREAREGVLLNNNRFSFARSAWLTQLDRNEPTNVPDQLLTNIQPSERDTTKATKQRVNLSKVVPLGDLKVKHAGVWPPLMEQGFWPSKEEYNLSDHGLVHCLFTANVTYV